MHAATHILSYTDSHAHLCTHRADCKTLMSQAAAFFSETRRLLCPTREARDIGLSLAKEREREKDGGRCGGVVVREGLPVTMP